MILPAEPPPKGAVLWSRRVQFGVGVMTLIGSVLVGYAAAESRGTAQLEKQVDLATMGLAGLGLIVAGLTAWVVLARGRLVQARVQFTHWTRPAPEPADRPAVAGANRAALAGR